jgi:hypothetical protein
MSLVLFPPAHGSWVHPHRKFPAPVALRYDGAFLSIIPAWIYGQVSLHFSVLRGKPLLKRGVLGVLLPHYWLLLGPLIVL